MKKEKIYKILGFLTICISPVWIFLVSPEILEMPENFKLETRVDSFDNIYDPVSKAYLGETKSESVMQYKAISGDIDHLKIQNTFSVNSAQGEKIFEVARIYDIDSHTGKHINTEEPNREGYLFAPKMRGLLKQAEDKASFTYWHANYNNPIYMEYRDAEKIFGVDVYRYEANFQSDQTEELSGKLPSVGEILGVSLDVNLHLWVDPYTGTILKYADFAEAYFYNLETKERVSPWNKFHNETTTVSTEILAKQASFLIYKIYAIEIVIPILLLILGLILFFIENIKALIRRLYTKSSPFLLPLIASTMVLLFALIISLVALQISQQQKEAEFESEINTIDETIENQLENYASILSGARGLFDASDQVSSTEWKTYVGSFDLEFNHPGAQGVGFAQHIQSDLSKEAYKDKTGNAFETIFPKRQGEIYVPVTYLEPSNTRNSRALGYDMFSEEARKQAIEYARDSNNFGLTKKVTLVQETENDVQAGFLMYLPVYKPNTHETLEDRRQNIYGYVYMPFRASNFMIGVFNEHNTPLDIQIFANTFKPDKDDLIYENVTDGKTLFSKEKKLRLYNQEWLIVHSAKEGFGANFFRDNIPYIVFSFGLVLAVLLFIVIYTINTRRAKAIEIAKNMTQEFETQKARNEAILAGIGEGLFFSDKTGHILYVNKAFERLTGYKANEVINKKITEVIPLIDKDKKIINPEERPIFRTINSQKITTTTSIEGYSFVRKEGDLLPVDITTSPIIEQGEFVGVVELFRDNSEEKEIDKAKSEFVSLASHQLKTPLTAIKWYTEIVSEKKRGDLSEEQREYLKEIRQATERMSELVNSLLNVSRLELGTFAIEPKMHNLLDIARSVIKEQEPIIKKREQNVTLSSNKESIEIPVDQKLFFIIIQNLLSNASKYSPKNTQIEIKISQDTESVYVTCSDKGYGIPDMQKKNIFKKLFRAENIKKLDVDGTGLGLYIVKTIIDNAGCNIDFTSEEGKGTSFTIKMPNAGMLPKSGTRTLSTQGE